MPTTPEKPLASVQSDLRAELHARFRDPLVRFFRRRIPAQANAEDLAQETLLRVLRAGALDRVDDPERYVFRVAINQLRDHQRLARRFDHPSARIDVDAAIASEQESQLMEDFDPERVISSRDTLRRVMESLGELDERTRNIFVLFKLENMRQKDIAALYGIAQSTIEKYVVKATAHLLARHGGSK